MTDRNCGRCKRQIISAAIIARVRSLLISAWILVLR